MSTEQYLEAYGKLSQAQKKVVEWDNGPLLVLAGPGAGKTAVLTCRIARILDSSPNKNFRILGLTFTNKAADEMRARVSTFVPGEDRRLFLGTFHSFCADILRQHGAHIGINPDFRIYSQSSDLQAVLDEAIEQAKRSDGTVGDLDKRTLPVIQRLKQALVPPAECPRRFENVAFGQRIAVAYSAYEDELARRNAVDFDSLVLRTYQLLTQYPVFAKRYRAVYRYICVDEFQDTNRAQYRLIRALAQDQDSNLFVVADDDQIIFHWNGASHRRINELVDDYSCTVRHLPVNYRCPPEVVDLANSLISHNFLRARGKQPLQAFRPRRGQGVVRLLPAFADSSQEAGGVAGDIQKRLSNGRPDSVAVLARNRRLLEGVQTALESKGIAAVISQRKDEFESTPFAWLHAVLRLANDRHDQRSLEAVCGAFSRLAGISVDPESIVDASEASGLGYLYVWATIVARLAPNNLRAGIIDQVLRSLDESRDFRTFSRQAVEWFDGLIREREQPIQYPGAEVFARYSEEKVAWRDLMREITSSLGEYVTLEAFLQELQMRSKEPPIKPGVIPLLTIHSAKGKEYDHVYLVGLVEGELPSYQSIQTGDSTPEMEEERRACYVAITRAIESLTLSYAARYRGWSRTRSRFLQDMGFIPTH